MKNSLLYILIILVCSCKEDKQDITSKNKIEQDTIKYQLVWQDEFNNEGNIDSLKWNFEYGFIRNHEEQYYTDRIENARVDNGLLVLETQKEEFENENFVSSKEKNWKKNKEFASYTAASITTKDIAQWKYGKMVVRAKLPEGRGLWPAIWMLGENWREVGWPECGEIDIMEHVGFSKDSIFGTVHTKSFNHTIGTQVGKSVFIENPYSEFHDYEVQWTPKKVEFILDGNKYHEFENTGNGQLEWPFDQPFHMKLNVAVGGDWGGLQGIDDSIFPNSMLVDYVRIYQLK
ncbi:family 16 glycosylhydrolase [Maribacter sp. Asnod1-A12]|uniref:glycoside hydrolase family 16 protein n=1 Tax=Maribacter sp. Asnod1-A12 TaxID=3160576 RepID=UPI00386D32DC